VPSSELDARIAEGRALSRAGRDEDAIASFQRLVEEFPEEPRAHFELAGTYDYVGREAEAVAPYRRAMELGLIGDDVPRWYVQLGSTLRNVGETEEAVRLLSDGQERFPDDAAIRVFLALALHSAGRDREALVALLDVLLANREGVALRGYERAIGEYTDELRTKAARKSPIRPGMASPGDLHARR
jgi:Flp pilus assembly protein TadD